MTIARRLGLKIDPHAAVRQSALFGMIGVAHFVTSTAPEVVSPIYVL
jgi:hypothetical protein